MQLRTSGHLAVCSYSNHLYRLVPSLSYTYLCDYLCLFFLFSAIAELLDNAVDEVIISVGCTIIILAAEM